MIRHGILASLAISVMVFSFACTDANKSQSQNASAQQDSALPVSVIRIKPEVIEEQSSIPGRVEAFNSAEIRPQVSGIIEAMFFTQGSFVEKGEQLYQIDPSVFQAELQSAQAQLQNAEAELEVSNALLARLQSLLKTQAVSQQEFENAQAASEKAQANVALAEAAVRSAELNVEYTKMHAPISGYIGSSSVTQGALVTAQQSQALAVIQQLDPVYVDLTLSVSNSEHIQNFARVQAQRNNSSARELKEQETDAASKEVNSRPNVELIFGDSNQVYQQQGELIATDLQVDEATGSVQLRAIFPNSTGQLIPGMYVNARILASDERPKITVPQKAVSIAPNGDKTLWVVDEQNRAQQRTIVADSTFNNHWIVKSGLSEGDIVIVEGIMKLRPDSKVQPEFQDRHATSQDSQAEEVAQK